MQNCCWRNVSRESERGTTASAVARRCTKFVSRVEQSAYPFIHLCSCTFHESRIVGNHSSVKVQWRHGGRGWFEPFDSVSFDRCPIDRAMLDESVGKVFDRRLTASPRKDTYRMFYYTLRLCRGGFHWRESRWKTGEFIVERVFHMCRFNLG